MRSKREMTPAKFERINPDLMTELVSASPKFVYRALRRSDGQPVAESSSSEALRAVWQLSEAVYKLAALDQMEAQGFADANTGQTGIGLEGHHITHRAKGRDDSQSNLAAVSRRTHQFQHEGKK